MIRLSPLALRLPRANSPAAYAGAVLCVAAATGLRAALDPAVGTGVPYATFYVAMVVAALGGGLGPGLLALGLGALTAWYLFVPPSFSLAFASRADAVGLLLYGAEGMAIVAASAGLRRALEQLGEIQRRLMAALAASATGTWYWNIGGNRIEWDAAASRLLGFGSRPAATAPAAFLDLVHPQDRAAVARHIRACADGHADFALEFRVSDADGAVRWLYGKGQSIRRTERDPAAVVGAMVDVTERKEAEIRERFLSALGDRLRALSEPDAVLKAAAEAIGCQLGATRAGYSEIHEAEGFAAVRAQWHAGHLADLEGRFPLAMFGEAVVADLRQGRIRVTADTEADRLTGPFAAAFRRIGARAAVTVPLIRGESLQAALHVFSDTPRRWREAEVALCREVAERTWAAAERALAEKALRESEEHLRLAMTAARMGTWVYDVPSGTRTWSPEGKALMGISPDTVPTYELLMRLVHPDDRERFDAAYRRAFDPASGGAFAVDHRIVRPADGAVRWLAARGRVGFDAENRPVRAAGVNFDITERMEAEARLAESEQRLRATQRHAPAGIAEVDLGGRFLRVNERLCAITGYSREEMLGLTILDITHPDDRAAEMENFRRLVAGDLESYRMEKHYLRKDGTLGWVELAASMVREADGRPLYGIRIVADITERKQAEERQRLLLNELNHRVKNTLATVQSLAWQTLRSGAAPEAMRDAFESRLVALSSTHNLLTRSHWEGAALRDVADVELAPYGGPGRRVVLDGPAVRLPPRAVLALGMAFHELATNAAKYGALSTSGGCVELGWTVESAPARRLRLEWRESGGPPVRPPERRGFGSRLVERGIAHELGGRVEARFDPAGLRCVMEIPLEAADEAVELSRVH